MADRTGMAFDGHHFALAPGNHVTAGGFDFIVEEWAFRRFVVGAADGWNATVGIGTDMFGVVGDDLFLCIS